MTFLPFSNATLPTSQQCPSFDTLPPLPSTVLTSLRWRRSRFRMVGAPGSTKAVCFSPTAACDFPSSSIFSLFYGSLAIRGGVLNRKVLHTRTGDYVG